MNETVIRRNDDGTYSDESIAWVNRCRYETLEEALEVDMETQFEVMFYKIECDTCGEVISNNLVADDLRRPQGILREFLEDMNKHNLTHYEKPNVAD